MIDAAIFDMDGVLIDSIGSAHRARTELLARQGFDIAAVPDPYGDMHRGASVKTFLDAVEQYYGPAIDREKFARDAIEFIYEDLQGRVIGADPDLLYLLRDFQIRGVPCAIASSGRTVSVENKLRILNIGPYFKVIVTGDDVAEHKPSPACYIHAMEKLKARPDHCIVFEDSTVGVQAAQAAGGVVVGFTGHNSDKKELRNSRLTIDAWKEISYDKMVALVRGTTPEADPASGAIPKRR